MSRASTTGDGSGGCSRLIAAVAVSLLLISPAPARAQEPVRIIAGPMFTLSGEDEITVWIQTNRPAMLQLETRYDAMGAEGVKQEIATSAARHICGTARLKARGADPAFMIAFYDMSGQVDPRTGKPEALAETSYRYPPRRGSHGLYRFAFGSCSHQEKFAEKQPIWAAIAKQKPDCFLFIGDNIYLPNRASEYPKTRDEVFKLYCDTYDRERRMPEMQSLLRSTMSFALWDDHDYGPNNSDRTWPWKDVALEAMKLYFPNNYGLPGAPGCFYKFSWGDIDAFMLDDRSFRDPNNDPKRKTFLGEKQLAWLKDGLAASKGTFKLIVCGNQILSDTHPHESWGVQFRPERDAFLEWLWERKLTGIIFLAGDRHFAELVRKKDPKGRAPDLWELTSSPLANDHYKAGPSFANPERVAAYAAGVNFGMLEFNTLANPPEVELKILDVEGKAVIQERITANSRQ